jgi:RHS repeat-associated protein
MPRRAIHPSRRSGRRAAPLSAHLPRRAPVPRLATVLLAPLALTLALAAPARAQDENDPMISTSPGSGTFTSPSFAVSIRFFDQVSLDTSTRLIVLNDTVRTNAFTHTAVTNVSAPMAGKATTSTATLTLKPGVNTLTASICDNATPVKNCTGNYTYTFTYVAGRPAVRVSPDGGGATAAAWTTQVHTFRVVNPGTGAGTYRLSPECRDAWTGGPHGACSTSPSSTVTVAAGDSANVTVTATGTAAGRQLLVRLSAELQSMPGVADAGWVDVTVAGAGGSTLAAPLIQAVPLTPGAAVDRSECVTVAVAPGAAYECGDVRMAHTLPAHRTYDRTWAPALTYNSHHAWPRPVLYADVTLPEGAAVPTTVQLVATIGGVAFPATFPGSDFTPGVPRRVAVQLDGGNWSTGLRHYVMQATAHYPSASVPSGTLDGDLPIVNRAGSPFGPGWWMAGLERLVCIDCSTGGARLLWVGGDGSTRVYEPLAWWQTWTSQNPDGAPDTLTLVGYSYYIRKIPGGGRVEFGGSGEHLRTVNRLGQTTTFFTQAASGVPDSIHAPVPAGQAARRWSFTYAPWLTQVRASAPGTTDRLVTLGHALGGGRITSITDPDDVATSYTYSQATGGANAVATVMDRRGTRHAFTYDGAWKLASARLYMSGLSPGNDDLVSSFEAGESRGVGSSVPLSHAYTLLDGPRTDVADHTRLWLTTQGAPRRIRDAMGGETLLTRGDGRFPSLVTAVRGPNARGDSLVLRSSAVYDTRGRVISDTAHNPVGNGANRVTTYGWNDAVDRPAWIHAPGGDTVRIAYDTVTRNPKWQEQGDSTRRVRFVYNADGQVERVRYPHPATGAPGGGGEDVRVYDVLGNLKRTVSPMGFVTLLYRDPLGRVVETRSPVHAGSSSDSASVANTGLRQTVAYSVMDRDTLTVTYGRAMTFNRQGSFPLVLGTPAETLTVLTTHDPGGLPLKVRRWSTPDTAHVGVLTASYEYDRASRRIAEGDTVQGYDYTTYDPAGNVVQQLDRRMFAVNTTYDAVGRVTRRIVPSVLYEPEDVNCADQAWPTCSFHFPTFPNAANGRYMVRADTALFSYDAAGGMVRAENGDAIVSRTYYPGGALATDSLRIRTWDRARVDLHAYGIAFSYDSAGRMRSLEHPRNLTGGVAQADEFWYDSITSALDSVISRTTLRFGYEQDLLGRVVSETYPGGTNTYRYDLGGRRTGRGGAYVDSLAYDARGKVLSATVGTSTLYSHYSGLGNLVATDWRNLNAAQEVDEYRVDALGHTVWSRSVREGDGGNHPEYLYAYEPGQSRISLIFNVLPTSSYVDSLQFTRDTTYRTYDDAGNVEMGSKRSWRTDIRKIQTRPYFGADGRLRAEQGYEEMNGTPYLLHERRGYFSEHRYDALGRRVLVRTRRDGLCYKGTTTIADCTGGITRYVWAGDNLLWEMRGPGADSVPATRLDDISAPGQEFGVVGYTHAGGIDQPLVVWKGAGASPTEVVVPHANWRGVFGKGTTSSGATSSVPIEWPGFKTTAYHRMGPSQQPMTNWMGSLIGGQRDPGGTMYMRNRYYDPATGQFTQTDPIGIAGGLNGYGYANGDPVGNYDPWGLECEPRGQERLHCTDVGPGDYRTIRNFLGGEAGANAYATFESLGLTEWSERTCRGGFSYAQCGEVAEAQARLTLHPDSYCSRLGVRSTRRFQRGKFRFHPGPLSTLFGNHTYAAAKPLTGYTILSSELFAGGEYYSGKLVTGDMLAPGEMLYRLNVHEEEHHTGLFRLERAALSAENRCR